ncbi:MAG TPA: serine protease, partial [Anaerolineales bacterium]|nr:serine protease [Anaerolineales bacterium]
MRENLQNYIVFIEAHWAESSSPSRGTGFFINRLGLILTCQHVVHNGSEYARQITAKWENNIFELEVVSISPDPESLDYVLLRTKSGHIPADASIARLSVWEKSWTDPNQSDDFETYGFRSSTMKGLYATGHIDGLISTVGSDWHVMQLEPGANRWDAGKEGMSGAPVYHKDSGCVVGMILGRLEEDDSIHPLAVPIEEICKTCAPVLELVEKGNLYKVLVEVLRPGRWYTSEGLVSLYNNLTYPGLPSYDSLGNNKVVG